MPKSGNLSGGEASTSGSGLAERPRELEDWLNLHLYHPLSRRIAHSLVPTPVTPNMVSVAGGLLIVLAAFSYSREAGWLATAIGLMLHMGWHVLDGADGDLARMTGRASSNGELVDGICDYAGHIILYVVLGSMLEAEIGSSAWWWMWAAGIARIIQATHYEGQKRQYQWWVYGTPWLRTERKDGASGGAGGVFGWLAQAYVFLTSALSPGTRAVDAILGAADPKNSNEFQQEVRSAYARVWRWIWPLSANYRTIVLGVSMAMGSPIYFFVFEAVVLSAVLIGSVCSVYGATYRIRAYAGASSSR